MATIRGARNRALGRVRAVLFDLDDTLFDHAHATRAALTGLHAAERAFGAWTLDELVDRHSVILEDLHRRVLTGDLTVDEARIERFGRLLDEAGEPGAADRAVRLAGVYRTAYEAGWRAVPGALALLDEVRAAGLGAVIVTNNGVAEQRRKLERCGIGALVDGMVTSEEAGVSKPAREIFDEALRVADAGPESAVMFGDAWPTDIEGALGADIRPVWFNRRGLPRPDEKVAQIDRLDPVRGVLGLLRGPAR